MSMWWCLQLRREAASVPLARRLLVNAMDSAGVDSEVVYELSLALSEACANAVEHGKGESSDAYCVTAYLDGDQCRIEVADSGPGFRAAAASRIRGGPLEAETGRGLVLIESLADHLRVQNKPDHGGAVVTFDKTLKWQHGHGGTGSGTTGGSERPESGPSPLLAAG
ncbi:serine/threonine-protein kinase RsbW [Streptomyces sp. WMMB 714]|jgi:serine/threonine-protein kinase RsbW|uniref:ATP-binding protein n=1 Tax=Streptomyces sp. WMMB 714 TaxID=1286822 RepID=UPI000823B4DE|nr:ATP-binding protein [Streptomyces sp. WMMB 714]SCK21723.1 serine/threonine-protein kinase RsbW [Streptomyces sp. WMMB 714]